VLSKLYDRVVIPSAVLAELKHPKAPPSVSRWAAALPPWAEVKTASHAELDDILDPGEAEAIVLAEQFKADSLLLDQMEARQEAIRRGLPLPAPLECWRKPRNAISSTFLTRFHA
jgi:predicted nucleic acid-binding protein